MAPRVLLVVDDSAVVRALVRRALAGLDALSLEEADDGDRALARCQSGPVDLVITDLDMPRMSGFAWLEALRREGVALTPRVAVMSTDDSLERRERALGLGVCVFLRKPFSAAEVRAEVTALVEQLRRSR
ncbi:MAG: response regulator [Myxococcales bacterium]|nr:response regulator [Myxococcales bacterium]